MGNSKGPSGYNFSWFYKIYFTAFLHKSFKIAYIWLTHQSKALIFYFDMKKILSPIFENFLENRQSKFHVFKFNVCVNTHYIWTYEIHFVCFPRNFQISDLKFLSCQNRKLELSIDGRVNHIWICSKAFREKAGK